MDQGGDGVDSTQYGVNSNVASFSFDGHEAANVSSLSFDEKGVFSVIYNNGEAKPMSQVAVSKFKSNEGLFRVGKNLFRSSRSSGEAATGRPDEGGRGSVFSNSLELSNVDLAQEFINLMAAQRNFQANVKTLNTADKMLKEVININT